MLESSRRLICRGDHTVRHPGNVEELYGELAKRIHAKDDEGVRRVFRELLDAGRSRQEIMSEIVRLIDAKPQASGF